MVVAGDLLAEFLNEATSHLDAADSELARLPQDAPAAILGILRRIHTIRGTAGFLDLPQLEQLRVVEVVLDDLRGRATMPDDVDRRVRGALAIARAVVAAAERPGLTRRPHAPVERSGKQVGHDGPRLLVSGAVIERLAEITDMLASTSGELPERARVLVARLQHEIGAARSQPLRCAWSKLGRLVEEIAKATGKNVAFQATGEDVLLDYRAILLVRDALAHVVRNAAHHGIESPTERAARGKPPVGSISVTAVTDREEVKIEVADDGAGLDYDALRSRAVALGLMTEEAAARVADADLAEIVFTPGFSTSDSVGSLSGLGMGLDIVRTNIAELDGRVAVHATGGAGLRLTIAVPIRGEASDRVLGCEPQRDILPMLLVARQGAGRDALKALLSALGHVVETAEDADSALSLALGRSFMAIIADQDLPDRPGLDLARALRRHPPTADIALVLLLPSGSRLADSDRRSLDLLAIPHPFGRASLRGPAPRRSAA